MMAKEESKEITVFTKYEIARMLGSRALQIACGAPFTVEINEEELEKIKYNPVEIAKKELAAGKLPISVKRPLPGTTARKEEKKEEKKEENK